MTLYENNQILYETNRFFSGLQCTISGAIPHSFKNFNIIKIYFSFLIELTYLMLKI